jgi:hypothetical protein
MAKHRLLSQCEQFPCHDGLCSFRRWPLLNAPHGDAKGDEARRSKRAICSSRALIDLA